MNDRHLFRGKRKDNGKWVEGNFIDTALGFAIRKHEIFKNEGGDTRIGDTHIEQTYSIDPATLGQCTGLRDKNGELIWEGDVVETERGIGYIKWHDKGLTGFLVEFATFRLLVKKDYEYNIIGNIHDNPELLQETEL
jgi:uncharacterized phage protein (TIGR01671 family)